MVLKNDLFNLRREADGMRIIIIFNYLSYARSFHIVKRYFHVQNRQGHDHTGAYGKGCFH
jgi:hypothetical protein